MEYKKIEVGSHAGDYLVEIDGVKKIMTYVDILELQAKQEAKKVTNSEVVQEIDNITFPNSDIEPTIADIEEAPVVEEEIPRKKKSRRKK
jgi:hypothetical protein